MNELLSIVMEIRDLLVSLNSKIDNLTEHGIYSISDIVNEVNSIKGSTGYDLTDIHKSLDSFSGLYSLDDIYYKVDSIDTNLMLKD